MYYISTTNIIFTGIKSTEIQKLQDTDRKTRKSWLVWEENGKYANLILEILSQTTAITDRELKKEIYQNTFRTLDYFWFDPYTLEFAGFHLVDGE